MKKNALTEAAKEFARIAVLSLLPLVVAALEAGNLFTKATLVALAVAVLRALDSYIHNNKNIKANGLLPF
jgi:hypothetical protein